MPKIFLVNADGSQTVIDGPPGESVMKAAVRQGVAGIVGQCGGVMLCATCHVFLAEDEADRYPPVSEMEDEMLDGAATEREHNSRLSCQLILQDGIDVHASLPPRQL